MSRKYTPRALPHSKARGKRGAKTKDRTDLRRVRAQTDAAVRKAVDTDPDSFAPDAAWLRRAKLVMPQRKETVTLRLDPDVLSWFRREGRGYQTRINAVLRAFVQANAPLPR
jgi:uncharacterized protein (DUF4415 family)